MARDWLVLEYAQAAPFSLRLSVATTAAAVTALVPSPACFKLAMVDAAFQAYASEQQARRIFDLIKGREVRVRVPKHIVVQKTFGRVLVPWEAPKTKGADRAAAIRIDFQAQNYPFKRTISFLEIAYWSEPIEIAIDTTGVDTTSADDLRRLAWCVRYLGKRGSFVQLLGIRVADDEAISRDGRFGRRIDLMASDTEWPAQFIQRPADDLGPNADFERVSAATEKKVRRGEPGDIESSKSMDRLVGLPFLLPLRLQRTGRSFAYYMRTGEGAT
jgi:hypothetical protein